VNDSGDSVGVLTGYSTGTGYDLATGLGSVNATNLVNSFGPNFYLSSSNPVVAISTAGASGTMGVTAYSLDGYTGTVNFACSDLPKGATCEFSPSSATFTSSITSVRVTVTVNTTSSSVMKPAKRREDTFPLPVQSESAAVISAFGLLLVAGTRRKELGWNAARALALVVFLLVGLAACGGGGKGPTGNTTAVLTGTDSTGAPTSSMTFTVTIE
jgi:hypothetical protein